MDLKEYRNKSILAWLHYNPNYGSYDANSINNVCYVYPRYIVEKNHYELVDSEKDFPTLGRIEVRIQGGDIAEDVYSQLGPIVAVRINGDLYPHIEKKNHYTLKYNPKQYGKYDSEIWLEKFSGKEFYQIIDVNSSYAEIEHDRSILEPDHEIKTTHIFLRYENKMFGPFEYDTTEGTTALYGVDKYQYCVGEYSAVEYNDELLIINDQNGEEALILIPKSIIPSPEECEVRYDWISEEKLINSFVDSLRVEYSYTREQVRQLKEMFYQLVESGSGVQFTNDRIAKMQALLQSIGQKEEYIRDFVEYALTDEGLKTALAQEVVNNYFDQIQSKMPDFSSVQERINDLKTQETALQQSIDSLQESAKPAKVESSEEDKLKISQLTQDAEELRKENEILNAKLGIRKEIEDLKAEREHWKEERDKAKVSYDQQVIDNNDLKKQFESTLQAFNDKATTIARTIDSKLLDKILRGIGEEPAVENIVPFDTSLLHDKPMDAVDIIKRVTDFISEKAHRDVTANDVANYLICITQGFITTFAGELGTGKTSICNILAKALGLAADPPQKRFVDISVERGWSSHKDFIGYYNPLSKKVERSNGEVFDAFERMDGEYDCDPTRIAPFIVLLDEANLSPIEHYWAAFLRNCDFASVSNRSIPLGGSKNFKLPEHLRFLATVNFDHTTEELSPRFLDRSWVIMLEPTRVDDEIEIDEDVKNNKDMVPFGAMKTAFCIQEDDVIDEAIQNKWNAIQKIFRDHELQITPRNLKMVKNYCLVACRCMEHDTPATRFSPLDYAFSQKILPTINGNGENYRILIEELQKECTAQNMPISAKHLDRMKRIAESNMGFYQFFSH